jgi:hypothetical protein
MVHADRLESAARVPVNVIARLPHGKDADARKIAGVNSAIAVVRYIVVITGAERAP